MHHSACKMLGWGHLEEPTNSQNPRLYGRCRLPQLPAAAAHTPPTLEECDPPPLLLSSRRRQGGRQHMAPLSLARGDYLGNEKIPCPPSPLGRSCPPPCTFSTSSQTHSLPTCSYVVNSPRSSLHPPPEAPERGREPPKTFDVGTF